MYSANTEKREYCTQILRGTWESKTKKTYQKSDYFTEELKTLFFFHEPKKKKKKWIIGGTYFDSNKYRPLYKSNHFETSISVLKHFDFFLSIFE